MESWFLADPVALADYFGPGFNGDALGQTANVEGVPKDDVMQRLKSATRHTKKRCHDKARDSAKLLASIDPTLVTSHAPNCHRFFRDVEQFLPDRKR